MPIAPPQQQSKDSGSNFEEQLGELDTRIRRAEIALSELRLQRQTVISQWHLYSIGVWAAYLTWFVLYGWGAGNMDTTKMGEIAAIPGAAVVIYYVGVLISGFYIRRQQFEESNLDVLKRKKKEKVEELKKMTKFYETQRLLEKYDENAARNAALANQDELHPPGHSSQRRSPSNQRHPSAARNDGPRQPNVDQAGSSMQPGGSPNRPQVHGFPAQQSTPVAPNNPPLLSDSQYAALAAQLPPESRPDTPAVDTLHGSLAPGPYDSGYNLALGPRPWFDRIFDAIIGDHLDGPNNKYALICTRCHVHNGLASPLEFESIEFFCRSCGHFNSRRLTSRADSSSSAFGEQAATSNTPPSESAANPARMPHTSAIPPESASSTARSNSPARTAEGEVKSVEQLDFSTARTE